MYDYGILCTLRSILGSRWANGYKKKKSKCYGSNICKCYNRHDTCSSYSRPLRCQISPGWRMELQWVIMLPSATLTRVPSCLSPPLSAQTPASTPSSSRTSSARRRSTSRSEWQVVLTLAIMFENVFRMSCVPVSNSFQSFRVESLDSTVQFILF